MKPRIRISDHAVLRYLERVDGVNVVAVRKRLAEMAVKATTSQLPGATAVRFDGYRVVIENGTAVTVTATHEDKCAKRKTR